MIIKSIEIKNVRSFKNSGKITFNKGLNILIGPNAGGKSNLLEIIVILISNQFFKFVRNDPMLEESQKSSEKEIAIEPYFNPLPNYFEKHEELPDAKSEIVIELEAGKNDIDNIQNVVKYKKEILEEAGNYELYPHGLDDFIINKDLKRIKNKQIFKYVIEISQTGDFISNPKTNNLGEIFRKYLEHYYLLLFLSENVKGFYLKPSYIFFPPYRIFESASSIDLGSKSRHVELANLMRRTSKDGATSYFEFSKTYLADKYNKLCKEAIRSSVNIDKLWNQDKEIAMLKSYLELFGYDFEVRDECNSVGNTVGKYTVIIKDKKREKDISSLSSGEKEILNLIFAIFSLNIKGGLIVIDEIELHLHPNWQKKMVELIKKFSEDKNFNNQFIITTHSSNIVDKNVILALLRVYKENNESRVITAKEDKLPETKDLIDLVRSDNNEQIFFVDQIILVEGKWDRLILEKMIKLLEERQRKDYFNIEIVKVGGDGDFTKYRKLLETFKIKNYIIADLGYLKKPELRTLIREIYQDTTLEEILSNLSQNDQNNNIDAKTRLQRRKIYILSEKDIKDYLPKDISKKKIFEFTQDDKRFKKFMYEKKDLLDIIKKIRTQKI